MSRIGGLENLLDLVVGEASSHLPGKVSDQKLPAEFTAPVAFKVRQGWRRKVTPSKGPQGDFSGEIRRQQTIIDAAARGCLDVTRRLPNHQNAVRRAATVGRLGNRLLADADLGLLYLG